jgi:hypothetical protein
LDDRPAHALTKILIGAHDDTLVAGRREDPHGGRNQVIGFDAAALEDLETEKGGEALNLWQLLDDFLRRFIALGLLVRHRGEMAVRAAKVKEDGATIRRLPFSEVLERLHPTV